MQRATEGSDLLEQVVDVGNWRVVLLDSSIPGAVPGYLEEDQLELLRRAIDSAGERFLLVSFHHHPVPIGSDWMDPIGLRNPQALFDLLAPYPQVRCLLWGTFTRSSTASAARCACWLRRPPAYSSPPVAATSPSTAWRRATAGCACTTTGAWKRGSRGSMTSSSKWTTTPPDTDMPRSRDTRPRASLPIGAQAGR